MTRFYFTLIVITLLPVLPWWLFAGLVLFGAFWFSRYFEGPALFFLYDLSFGLPNAGLLKNQFSFTIISLVALLLIEWYKERLRFYPKL